MIQSFIDTYKNYRVHTIPCREDNYTFIIEKDNEGVLIDSSLYETVNSYLNENEIKLKKIIITHHHFDHVDGIKKLSEEHQCEILCSKTDFERGAVPEAHKSLEEGFKISLLGLDITVIKTNGHTAGHISLHIKSLNLLFCADTLFSLGCGRVFPDGNIQDLFRSLQKIATLPTNTQIYCAHEYTMSNILFLKAEKLISKDIEQKVAIDYKKNGRTIPTSLNFEKQNNPFLSTKDFKAFKLLRCKKDQF